ncbi:MAG: hypothetical protein U0228_38880 [Myxococcaceae bacterium]
MPWLETTWLNGRKERHDLEDVVWLRNDHCACVLRRKSGAWDAKDLDARETTHLNGARLAMRRLEHGDTLWLWDRLVRFVDAPELDDTGFAQLIEGTAETEGRVQVWADALLEHGDPLGTALAHSGQAALFEGLAGHVMAGHLEVTWRHGLPRHVTLRMMPEELWPEAVLLQLLALRSTRWLESIVFDGHGARPADRLELSLLRTTAATRWPSTLRRFSCTHSLAPTEPDTELLALRSKLPSTLTWEPPRAVASASLEVLDGPSHPTRPTPRGTRLDLTGLPRIGNAADDSLARHDVEIARVRFQVLPTPLGWMLRTASFPTRLNGRALPTAVDQQERTLADHRLLQGDVIDCGPWKFRFVLT